MKCSDIIRILDDLAPEETACSWDNPGLLIGRSDHNVSKILIALEITDDVVEMAVSLKADLIVTHHPMIFHPIRDINSGSFTGRRILRLLRHDISCYAMHTNFDMAPQGMGVLDADRLGLTEQRFLDQTYEFTDSKGKVYHGGLGRIGQLKKPMTLRELAELTGREFRNEGIRVFAPAGGMDKVIHQAAIVPGSGGDMTGAALDAGADVLITGDVSHHTGRDAVSDGLMILDAGHYSLEFPFEEYISHYLDGRVSADVELIEAPYDPPFSTLILPDGDR
ncbi:MAG: Nif3-like dinuclear metal center hexameric protein [Lachnospiraceae bacterium]|jgi:dinuclear metal center YbgI/SA1388 family protein